MDPVSMLVSFFQGIPSSHKHLEEDAAQEEAQGTWHPQTLSSQGVFPDEAPITNSLGRRSQGRSHYPLVYLIPYGLGSVPGAAAGT